MAFNCPNRHGIAALTDCNMESNFLRVKKENKMKNPTTTTGTWANNRGIIFIFTFFMLRFNSFLKRRRNLQSSGFQLLVTFAAIAVAVAVALVVAAAAAVMQ